MLGLLVVVNPVVNKGRAKLANIVRQVAYDEILPVALVAEALLAVYAFYLIAAAVLVVIGFRIMRV